MKIFIKILLFSAYLCNLNLVTAQWCADYKSVSKTRIQIKRDFRIVTSKFLGKIRRKSVPYTFTTIEVDLKLLISNYLKNIH